MRDVESVKKSLAMLEGICQEEFDREFDALTDTENLQVRQALLQGISTQIKLNRAFEEASRAFEINQGAETCRLAAETKEYVRQADEGLNFGAVH
jgi:hypothetical protein